MSEGRFQPVVDVPAIALAVFIVIINSLALIMVAKKTYLRSITNLLLCSLALSDLLTGLVSVPLFITCNIVRRLAVCLTEEQLSRFISASIVSHLMSVVIDRWWKYSKDFVFKISICRKAWFGKMKNYNHIENHTMLLFWVSHSCSFFSQEAKCTFSPNNMWKRLRSETEIEKTKQVKATLSWTSAGVARRSQIFQFCRRKTTISSNVCCLSTHIIERKKNWDRDKFFINFSNC